MFSICSSESDAAIVNTEEHTGLNPSGREANVAAVITPMWKSSRLRLSPFDSFRPLFDTLSGFQSPFAAQIEAS
jgi:hypothetical protein